MSESFFMSHPIYPGAMQSSGSPVNAPNEIGKPPALNFSPENEDQECDNYFINNATGAKTCLSGGSGSDNSNIQQPGRSGLRSYDYGGGFDGGGGGGQVVSQNYGSNSWSTGPVSGGARKYASSSSSAVSGGGSVAQTGGKMALDPNLLASATSGASNLMNLGNAAAGSPVPDPGQMPSMLWDKYKDVLSNPAAIANDPAYQFMLQQAQQASGRSLAAGRMSKSGNAAIQAAKVATGTAGNYLKQLTDIYGAGANAEMGRYVTGAGVGSQYSSDLLKRYGVAGNLYDASTARTTGLAAYGAQDTPATPAAPSLSPTTLDQHLYSTGQTQSMPGWTNPYAMYPGDYRAGMTQAQLAQAMQPRSTGW
jgi:hypothetical protein